MDELRFDDTRGGNAEEGRKVRKKEKSEGAQKREREKYSDANTSGVGGSCVL